MKREENPKFSGYKGPAPTKTVGETLDSLGIKGMKGTITPQKNARKIESNSKKIEKLMGMLKKK